MKVIQILPEMKAGGVERGVLDLVKYFRDSPRFFGFESIVVSSGGSLLEFLDQLGIKHYQLPVNKKSPFSLFKIPQLSRLLEKQKPEIVHARSRVPGWMSFFASRNSSSNFVTTAHGVYKNKVFSEVMGWGKFVICPSQAVARHMRRNYGVPAEKIVIIPRWVDLNKFKFNSHQNHMKSNFIVGVGRISPSKGYEYLIEAFRKVVRSKPYLKLKIVGPADKKKGRYLKYLKSMVAGFSLGHNVEFSGFSGNIEDILSAARLLAVPSLIEEAFGRVVVEAGACGVPVIASKVGGIQEIISDGKDGLLVPSADPDSLANAILRLVNDPVLSEKLSLRAREKVESSYTMDKALNRTARVYREANELKRILVIKISSLGDVILAIPSLARLRQEFPRAKISLFTLKKYAGLFYDCPYIDETISAPAGYKKIREIRRISRRLRRKSFDYIIDLQNNRAAQLIAFLSFPRKSFGFRRKLGFLLNHTAVYKRGEKVSPLDSQERILKLLGIIFPRKELLFWETKPVDLSPFCLGDAKLIGISVSASPKWPAKNWPLENINSFIRLFLKHYTGYNILLLGDRSALARAEKIDNLHKNSKIINLCGKTNIVELTALLKKLNVFIAPDTAVLHLSQSLGIETIGLFGPTDPKRHTVSADNLQIAGKNLACRFCYRRKCGRNICMEKISAKEIFSRVKKLLA